MILPWDLFLGRVRERGEYATDKQAEGAVRVVLTALAALLPDEDRSEIVAQLPQECAPLLLDALPATKQLTPEEFVQAVALLIDGATEQTAHWDTGAVLSTVADSVGDGLVQRILDQLPPGYETLFGTVALTSLASGSRPMAAGESRQEFAGGSSSASTQSREDRRWGGVQW
ncbi:DUF2267 domain-containing protein [Streptomyces sp. NPDC006393]|uniref:DUF2267 domain-containing protein n=1 Tax=Streptomyces sp. NPDC006393 TaxID=3156763 RepID=UPI0033E590E8